MVLEKRIFVLHHDHYAKLPHQADILDTDHTDDIQLEKTLSPITLFMLNGDRELEVLAIQTDSANKGFVYIIRLEMKP